MKTPPILLSLPLLLLVSSLAAQTDGTWTRTNTAITLWGDTANWLGGNIADGIGATANFTAIQGGTSRTVNVDTVNRTVGVFNLLNQHVTAGGGQSHIFATTTGQTLTFNNGANPAQLNILVPAYESAGSNTISLGVRLGSSLVISNNRPLSANTLTISGPVSASTAGIKVLSNVGAGPAPVIFSGAISDGDGQVAVLQNSATSALSLNGANSFTGGTVIKAGQVNINSNESLGANTSSVTLDGGTLATTVSLISNVAREFIFDSAGGTLRVDSFLNIDGVVSGSGAMVKTGTQVLSLNNDANTHTGNIDVQVGILRIRRGDGSLGGPGNSVTLASGTTFRVANLGTTSTFELAADRTFTLTSGTVSFFMDTDNPMSSLITGDGGISKTGAAVLELKGANTYAGGTVVNMGVLAVENSTGSATGSGAVTINTDATLRGSGRIAGATTIAAGAFLAPGSSLGVLTFDDTLTLAGTTTFEINGTARGTGYDGIDVGGLLTSGGSLVLNFGALVASDATFQLFQLAGGQTGDFATVSIIGSYVVPSLDQNLGVWTGLDGDTSFSFDQGSGVLSISVIPEPATYAALAGLAALALCLRRRRTLR